MIINPTIWLRKRYFEFRVGNNIYIAFSAALANFLLISHRLLIEQVPTLQDFFGDLISFSIIFLITYIPFSVALGHWHYKEQEKIQNTYMFMQNPGIIKSLRLLVELQTGTADKNDVESFKQLLRKIDTQIGDDLEK